MTIHHPKYAVKSSVNSSKSAKANKYSSTNYVQHGKKALPESEIASQALLIVGLNDVKSVSQVICRVSEQTSDVKLSQKAQKILEHVSLVAPIMCVQASAILQHERVTPVIPDKWKMSFVRTYMECCHCFCSPHVYTSWCGLMWSYLQGLTHLLSSALGRWSQVLGDSSYIHNPVKWSSGRNLNLITHAKPRIPM